MKTILLLTAGLSFAGGRSMAFRVAALLLVALLFCAMVAPQPAYAQLGGLGAIPNIFNTVNQVANNILNFIQNTMRPLLQGIQSAAQALQNFLSQLRNLWEQIVWPIAEINRAKALAQQLIGTFRGLLNT
jgi:hypothetical protein